MLLMPLTLLHVCSATVGLLSGFTTIAFRKGSGLHGAAGSVFFRIYAQYVRSWCVHGGIHQTEQRQCDGRRFNFLSGCHGMGGRQAQRADCRHFRLERAPHRIGDRSCRRDLGPRSGDQQEWFERWISPFLYFIFGSIALLFAASDVRMVVRGGVSGAQRIARHLWRMSLALLFAMLSFYPSRAHLFPRWLNENKLSLCAACAGRWSDAFLACSRVVSQTRTAGQSDRCHAQRRDRQESGIATGLV